MPAGSGRNLQEVTERPEVGPGAPALRNQNSWAQWRERNGPGSAPAD